MDTRKKKSSLYFQKCSYKAMLIATTIRQGCNKGEIRRGTLQLLFKRKYLFC